MKFLQIFANYPVSGKYIPKAPNQENLVIIEHELQQALANTDTVTLTLPLGVAPDLVPLKMICYSNAAPRVQQTNIAITSHNVSTGVTVLTASGAVADSSTIVMMYGPCTVGT